MSTNIATRVLIIARISTDNQDKQSCDDQVAFCRDWIEKNLKGPLELIIEKTKGSGEKLDRPELERFEEMVRTGQVTHVVCEESSRLCRRYYTVLFCELCEDHNVRFIAINDGVDTAKDWRVNGMFSSVKHEMSNKDTSQRIRRTLRNRFTQGGIIQHEWFGYSKPPGAKNDSELSINPALLPIILEVFRRIEEGASFCEVADWLISQNVPVGKHARTKKWDHCKVKRVVTNPIYKGIRERNKKMTRRVNRTGRHKSVDAPPEELLTRACPHLMIIEPERFDRINAMLKLRNEKYRRGRLAANNNRQGIPRKRTAWPGQHLQCGICKALFYWGGHGQKDRMMCSGRREYRCWNATSCHGGTLARLVVQHALSVIEGLPEYSREFRLQVYEDLQARRSSADTDKTKLMKEIYSDDQKILRITKAIAENDDSRALMLQLKELEQGRVLNQAKLDQLKLEEKIEVELPSMEEIKDLARQCLLDADFQNPDTYRLLSQLFPQIEVHPYMPIDGGSIVLRAHVTIHLEALKQNHLPQQMCSGLLKQQFVVDLFEPPQRIKVLKKVVTLFSTGITKKEVARQLKVAPLVVDRALKLQALMDLDGLTDPYKLATSLPGKSKIKCHEHTRFKMDDRAAG